MIGDCRSGFGCADMRARYAQPERLTLIRDVSLELAFIEWTACAGWDGYPHGGGDYIQANRRARGAIISSRWSLLII